MESPKLAAGQLLLPYLAVVIAVTLVMILFMHALFCGGFSIAFL